MKRKVVLTKTAQKQLEKLFDYLVSHWSENVKKSFVEKLDYAISAIDKQPNGFPESKGRSNLRTCVVTKQTTIFYRYSKNNIYIVAVFDTRQNPDKRKDIK